MARKKARRRQKAKKKQSFKYIFQDVKMKYYSGNYKSAASILRQAKIQAHEEKKAQQLDIKIQYHLAIEAFSLGNYKGVIPIIQSLSNHKETTHSVPLLKKAPVFLGLSYLFLNEYDKAATHLESAVNLKLGNFSIYYLLAKLYRNHGVYTQLSDFIAAYPAHANNLRDDQKTYLESAFLMLKNDLAQAAVVLDSFEATNDIQSANIQALRAILTNNILPYDERIKPLYKLLLELSLSKEEKNQLGEIKLLSNELASFEAKEKNISLKKQLNSLCLEGRPLSAQVFEKVLQTLSKEYYPYLVYNQVAALYNENLEKNATTINQIINNHQISFFQVPESLFLYLSLVSYDESPHLASTVWKNIDAYLKDFKHLLSQGQLDQLGWLLHTNFINSKFSKTARYKRKIRQLADTYQMVGLKLWGILDTSLNTKKVLNNKESDLFTWKNVQHNRTQITKAVEQFFKETNTKKLFNQLGDILGIRGLPDDLVNPGQNILYSFQNQFILSLKKQEVHPNAKEVILELFQLISKETIALKGKHDVEKMEELLNNYAEYLEKFEENHPQSSYFQDYQSLVQIKMQNKLKSDLLHPKISHVKEKLQELISAKENINEIINVFITLLDEQHFETRLILPLTHFFDLLYKTHPEEAVNCAEIFTKNYHSELKDNYSCEHPDEFYIEFLEELMRKFNMNNLFPVVYVLAKYYVFTLLEEENADFRLISSLLTQLMKRLKQDTDFEYDDNFPRILLNFLKPKILRYKRTTKLKRVYNDAVDFFQYSSW